jgi:hypothetical protein
MSGIWDQLFGTPEHAQLRRVEAKLDRILDHLGLEYCDPASPAALSPEVKQLADESRSRIEAIKLHRRQTGAGLREAKQAVDAYLASRVL